MSLSRLTLLALLTALGVVGLPVSDSAEVPFAVPSAWADSDDDSGDDDDDDDDDDNGGGSGGGNNDDDDGGSGNGGSQSGGDGNGNGAGGGSSGSNSDDDDNNGTSSGSGGSTTGSAAAANLLRRAPDRDRTRTFKQREIVALGLNRADTNRLRNLGFEVVSNRDLSIFDGRSVARIRTPSNVPTQAALVQARNLLREVDFDLSHLYRPSEGARVYAPQMVGLSSAGRCAANVRIGLIDTAVASNAATNGGRVQRKSFVRGLPANRDPGHGTAIAGLLVGGTTPLAPDATLYAADVFYGATSGSRADAAAIIEAVDWMAANGVRVVNMSLTGPANDLLRSAVQRAAERGLILVAAAGNDGPNAPPSYPAAYENVIAVSAIDARGRIYPRANRGSFVEIAAPGVDILASDANGRSTYWTGTSFAAPFVTATLARAVSAGPVRGLRSARSYLRTSAQDLGARGRDPVYGWGLIQNQGGC